MSSATPELGPVNASIHKADEHIELHNLDALKSISRQVLERLLLPT
jgi:succinyl-diaminopimelate desuccinylase